MKPCSKLSVTSRQPVNQHRYSQIAVMIMQHCVRLIGVTTGDPIHPLYLRTSVLKIGAQIRTFSQLLFMGVKHKKWCPVKYFVLRRTNSTLCKKISILNNNEICKLHRLCGDVRMGRFEKLRWTWNAARISYSTQSCKKLF